LSDTAPEADYESVEPAPRTWPHLVAGILLVGLAIVVGRTNNLAERLELDLNGERVQGTAEQVDSSTYILRYTHPAGTIHRKRYSGPFMFREGPDENFSLTLAYSMQDPAHFQPIGISYIPGAITGFLFVGGFMLVMRARQLVRHRLRARYRVPAKKDT
jgi:hypothetical protein